MIANRMKKNDNGQGIIEFAFVVIILVMAIYGALVIGQIFHVKTVMNNAAREGVRYLSLHPRENTLGYAGTIAAAIREAENSGVVLVSGDIAVSPPGGCVVDGSYCAAGSPVLVQVSKDYTMAWEWLFPSTITLVSEAQMVMN